MTCVKDIFTRTVKMSFSTYLSITYLSPSSATTTFQYLNIFQDHLIFPP